MNILYFAAFFIAGATIWRVPEHPSHINWWTLIMLVVGILIGKWNKKQTNEPH